MIERITSKIIDSNVFLITNEISCIIIDAGVEVDIVKEKVGDKNVEAIFLTHGHYDHCFYIEDYIKTFACPVFASENIKDYLCDAEHNYSEGKLSFCDFSNFKFLSNEGTLNLNDFVVEYKQLGGHSKSDMFYRIDDDVFVGDVLIGRDMGRIDLYGGDKEEMKKSLQFLLQKNYKTLHSGHGIDNEKNTQDKVIKLWLKFLNR